VASHEIFCSVSFFIEATRTVVHVCKRKQPQHPRPLRGLENNYLTLDVGPEVVERRCTDQDRCAEALQFGVRTMPTVMVDGETVFEGRINRVQAALLASTP